MKTSEIRQIFLDFFEKKGHKILPSSSLVPQDDPTLLFTNAGMVQFKKFFLGEMVPDYRNVATVQRCIRAGGKHNDLENVGKTSRHMTFFEMLGNFSFGGYFKEKAIVFAWELVTDVLKIPRERILATVYEEDDEAEDIWRRETDVKDVVRAGKDSNFWTMGEEGPCGPCSEIVVVRDDIDIPYDHICSSPICDCDRYIEIWNLVFMQFNLRKDGILEPLKTKNIDTGMGLERVAMLIQRVPSVFDTDVFSPLKSLALELLPNADVFTSRVAMDAARASTFAIADGIMPSNESRGYVIRRIIRRALRYAMKYTDRPFLNEIAKMVIETMSDFWSYLERSASVVQKTIRMEEEKFLETISRALPIFEKEVADFKSSLSLSETRAEGKEKVVEFPADIVFGFWDTHGLPVDVMKEVLAENSLFVDETKLQELIDSAKRRTKRSESQQFFINIPTSLHTYGTEFLGYFTLVSEARILEVLSTDGKPIDKGSGEVLVVTDKTPFYPEGGGQVGDVGYIKGDNIEGLVIDTKKSGDVIFHRVRVKKGILPKNMRVVLEVDHRHREQTSKHHTSTHLLHSALRKVLGSHVRQMGSLVERRRLRFDFSHPVQLSDADIRDIEDLVNRWIMADYDVTYEYMKIDEALRLGALAFFGDKYGKVVRVVRIGDVSLELCGGTHLSKSGEAGMFKILRETGVSSGIRRIEAVAGWELLEYIREREKVVDEIAAVMKTATSDIVSKAKSLVEENARLKNEIDSLRREMIKRISNPEIHDVKGVKLIFDYLQGFSRKELGHLADRLREKFSESLVVLISENLSDIDIVVGTNSSKYDSGEIVRKLAQFLGGSGGGKQTFAEGRGKIKKSRQEIVAHIIKVLSGEQ